jgi:hypothetical protein
MADVRDGGSIKSVIDRIQPLGSRYSGVGW